MIVDHANSLVTLARSYENLRRNAEQVARFAKIRNVLAEETQRLRPLIAMLQTLREAKIAECDFSKVALDHLETLAKARKLLLEQPELLIDSKMFDLAKFVKGIKALTKSLNEELLAKWQKHARGRIPATKSDVLDVLGTAFPSEIRHLRQLSEKLYGDCEKVPLTIADVQNFENGVQALQRAWSQVGGGDLPVAVTTFLHAAASPKGASLVLYSEEVCQWLTQHKILASFSIKVLS